MRDALKGHLPTASYVWSGYYSAKETPFYDARPCVSNRIEVSLYFQHLQHDHAPTIHVAAGMCAKTHASGYSSDKLGIQLLNPTPPPPPAPSIPLNKSKDYLALAASLRKTQLKWMCRLTHCKHTALFE